MTEITNVLYSVTRNDGRTLNIVDRSKQNSHTPYVVCWNVKLAEFNHAEWDWGTYCEDLKQAYETFKTKAQEHNFSYDPNELDTVITVLMETDDDCLLPCDLCNMAGSDTCMSCNEDGKFDNAPCDTCQSRDCKVCWLKVQNTDCATCQRRNLCAGEYPDNCAGHIEI